MNKAKLMNETAIRTAMENGIIPKALGEKMIYNSKRENACEYPKDHAASFNAMAKNAGNN